VCLILFKKKLKKKGAGCVYGKEKGKKLFEVEREKGGRSEEELGFCFYIYHLLIMRATLFLPCTFVLKPFDL